MEAGEGEGAGQAPLVGFLFGNVDENNRVEADYLDEASAGRGSRASGGGGRASPRAPLTSLRLFLQDARDHLGGLARVQGGALDLQAGGHPAAARRAPGAGRRRLEAYARRSNRARSPPPPPSSPIQEELRAGQQPGAGSAAADAAAVQPAPDARDFADEAELIEDAEQQSAAAAAMRQRQLGVVTAALRSGEAAEDEDYDEEDEEEAPAAHALQPPLAPVPIVAAAVDARLTPRMQREYRQHVRLPVLGHSMDGEAVLRFSELYGHQGVMAGHVSTTDELRPPALLRRRQHRHAAQRLRQQRELAAERDEEALLHLADLEAPAGALCLRPVGGCRMQSRCCRITSVRALVRRPSSRATALHAVQKMWKSTRTRPQISQPSRQPLWQQAHSVTQSWCSSSDGSKSSGRSRQAL